MLWTFIQAAARHGMTSAGGALVADGLASQQDATAAIGFGMAILGFLWSCLEKAMRKQDPPSPPSSPGPTTRVPVTFLALASIAFVLGFTGCQSPQQITFRATGTTIVTVDAAMNEWGAYVKANQPGTNAELAVKNGFEKYQASMAVVCDAGAAYSATGGTNATATAALNEAIANSGQELTDLETLITSFGVRLK